jgi:hypothetical protein
VSESPVESQHTRRGAYARSIGLLGVALLMLTGAALLAWLVWGRRAEDRAMKDESGRPYSAEELLARLKTKVTTARLVRGRFAATIDSDPPRRLEGSMASNLDGGDFAVEFTPERAEKVRMSSEELRQRGWEVSRVRSAGEEFLGRFATHGVCVGWYIAKDEHVGDYLPRGVTLGPRTRINGRLAQVVEYELNLDTNEPPPGPPFARVSLWLDGETGLPIRREIRDAYKGTIPRITEEYDGLLLEGN